MRFLFLIIVFIFNIKEFAKDNVNIDAIKLAQIFLKFNKSLTLPLSKQTALNFIELKKFYEKHRWF